MSQAGESTPIANPPAITAEPRSRRRWLRWTVGLALTAAVLGAGPEVANVLFGSNWHCMIPGQAYRCAQLSGEELEEKIATYGIRTILNLRGTSHPQPWYLAECRVAHRAGASVEDVSLSATRYPSRSELCHLIDVLDHTEYPILLHCRRGSDRTGIIAAVVVLLRPDGTLEEAHRQLGPRFGHVSISKTGRLDDVCGFYEDWLREGGRQHSAAAFRDWLQNHYGRRHFKCRFEQAPSKIGPLRLMEPYTFKVRVRNDSGETWHFSPLVNAGHHVAYLLWDDKNQELSNGRAGMLEADVAPGQSIDVTVVLPPFRTPGRYRMLLDMVDEQRSWFYRVMGEAVTCEVIVGE